MCITNMFRFYVVDENNHYILVDVMEHDKPPSTNIVFRCNDVKKAIRLINIDNKTTKNYETI